MGLFRFLNRLPRTTAKTNLLIPKNNSTFIQTLNRHKGHNSIGLHRNAFLLLFRSIHDDSSNTQVIFDVNNQNPDLELAQIAEEREKLCKILSNHQSSSGIYSALDSAKVVVSPPLVLEVLKKLSNAGILALSFFRWAEKQNGFKHNTEIYNALIEALGKIKQFKMVWNLVSEMKLKGLLKKETFALITRRYARARKVKEAIEAFERMETFGLKLELSDFNRLIDTLCKSRHVEKAHQVFDKMKNRKFKPDIKSYTILLEGWGQEHNLLKLDEIYREMTDEGFEADVVAYGIIINAYCKAKKFDEAIRMFHEMKTKNIKPTPHIYCTLINWFGSEKRLSEAVKFFELSKASGFTPETPTYNALVGAYCWSQRMYDAYKVVDEMRKCGVGPNSRTFDIILHHLIRARRTKEAYSVFQKMSDECEPSVSTYEIMVRMFCNEERLDMAFMVWDQMKAKGVLPGMHMFSTLINSLCHESKLDDACKYFQEMLDIGIRPPAQMFSNLKQALLDEGKKDTVIKLGLQLEKLRKTPLVG
ncbi:Pentatricopeptide repeat-containing protein [Actinidia chinensis var. chinensis]|uniref:Pentatricopeptide repeat-containing protein n=1 Tax=Actinidia chinensis var. chinensis TaxID=1590841 RepID=A0A2R6P3Y3_ACTCC|nr:Pentatricopeptide repeat-containing protein [Actinidia chinensis var. chinensis]